MSRSCPKLTSSPSTGEPPACAGVANSGPNSSASECGAKPPGDAVSVSVATFPNARAASLSGLKIQGVAVHIGSQLTSLDPLERAFTRVGDLIRELRAEGHDIGVADLGGGLGVPYDPDQPPPPSPAGSSSAMPACSCRA